MTTLRRVALILVIIGAVNWGLIGLFRFDLVASIFGGQLAGLSRVIYTLVGISGLICLSYFFDNEAINAVDRDEDAGDYDRRMIANPNYGTEFAEDPDLDELFDPEKDVHEHEKED